MHWTPKRKAEVCVRILRGDETAASAVARHGLQPDEIQDWLAIFRRRGVVGLYVTTPPQPERSR